MTNWGPHHGGPSRAQTDDGVSVLQDHRLRDFLPGGVAVFLSTLITDHVEMGDFARGHDIFSRASDTGALKVVIARD
jgi:hypothetical protein